MPRDVRATDYLFALLAGIIVALLADLFTQRGNSYFPFGYAAIVVFVVIFISNLISLPIIGSMKMVRRSFYLTIIIINTLVSIIFAYVIAQGVLPNLSSALKIALMMGAVSLLATAIYATLCRWR